MCVQEPCVYLLSAASVVIRNTYSIRMRTRIVWWKPLWNWLCQHVCVLGMCTYFSSRVRNVSIYGEKGIGWFQKSQSDKHFWTGKNISKTTLKKAVSCIKSRLFLVLWTKGWTKIPLWYGIFFLEIGHIRYEKIKNVCWWFQNRNTNRPRKNAPPKDVKQRTQKFGPKQFFALKTDFASTICLEHFVKDI